MWYGNADSVKSEARARFRDGVVVGSIDAGGVGDTNNSTLSESMQCKESVGAQSGVAGNTTIYCAHTTQQSASLGRNIHA